MGACCWGLASWECHRHGPGWQAFNTEASRPPPPEARSCGPSGLLNLPAAPPAPQRLSSGEPPFPFHQSAVVVTIPAVLFVWKSDMWGNGTLLSRKIEFLFNQISSTITSLVQLR